MKGSNTLERARLNGERGTAGRAEVKEKGEREEERSERKENETWGQSRGRAGKGDLWGLEGRRERRCGEGRGGSEELNISIKVFKPFSFAFLFSLSPSLPSFLSSAFSILSFSSLYLLFVCHVLNGFSFGSETKSGNN